MAKLNEGLYELNKFLQDNPKLSKGRFGDSVTLIAIDAMKELMNQVEVYEKALKFYANNAHYEPFREEDLDRSDAFNLIDLDAGETAKDALGK